jgi:hypothetical protein
MSLILPKGFVVNHPGIIEKISAAPLDLAEIANFWKGNYDHHKSTMFSSPDSLHYYQAQTSRSYGRTSGELLVADMGKPETRIEECNYCKTLCRNLGRPELYTTSGTCES